MKLKRERRDAAAALLTALTRPRLNKYIPHNPHPKQAAFLLLNCREAFYGGAAGGGKSEALLTAALQYVDVPGYSALLLRRTYAQLAMPNSIMDRAHQWLGGTGAQWNGEKHRYTFPTSGAPATLTFGHMQYEQDKYQYQGPEFQFVGLDELTQFLLTQYTYMFSRTRRLKGMDVPIRVRSASNPGGIGHEWVYQRMLIEGRAKGRVFIPARLDDNPSLDRAEYIESLKELDPILLAQLLGGDWTVRGLGSEFRREWFEIIDAAPAGVANEARYWDLAATAEGEGNADPDWTVGARVARGLNDLYYLTDIQRLRGTPATVEARIKQTAELDGRRVPIYMEQEGGASGKALIDYYRRKVLAGYAFYGIPSTGSKVVRARPLSSQAQAGNVKIVRGTWVNDFLDEADGFPGGPHDDQIDAAAGAFAQVSGARRLRAV